MLANTGSRIRTVTGCKHSLSMKYFCKSMPSILAQNVFPFLKTTKLCVSIQIKFFTFVLELVPTITEEYVKSPIIGRVFLIVASV